ncbi:MAG: hypothetical protein MJD61_01225 [Proteobacteria bacterium]|nr:hypothetical protein [Pseudomonadota bacterium]
MMAERFDDLPDWRFEVEEASAGVFEVRGVDAQGRRVGAKGTDPDELLLDAKRAAHEVTRRIA